MTRLRLARLAFIVLVCQATISLLASSRGALVRAQNAAAAVEQDDVCVDPIATEDLTYVVHDTLQELRNQTFFRIFKVSIEAQCDFWNEDYQCAGAGCALCECTGDEVPKPYQEEELAQLAEVDRSLGGALPFRKFSQSDDMWIAHDEAHLQMTYVDLQNNPEGFTGYAGQGAARVWGSIYSENCFHGARDPKDPNMCFEERVFYRLVSGLHSAITATIACNKFGPGVADTEMYWKRLGDFPDRVNNLYFNFVFLLRALAKASTALAEFPFDTGNPKDDAATLALVQRLTGDTILEHCQAGRTFDETHMFGGDPLNPRIREFKSAFRNISRILDCVSCEKCRMWSKMQLLGLGTALKIMFSDHELRPDELQRNEVLALFVTLGKLSENIKCMSELREQRTQDRLFMGGVGALSLLVLVGVCLRRTSTWKRFACMLKRSARDGAGPAAASAAQEKKER